MPNLCSYTMKVVGRDEESVQEFISYMQADYNYSNGEDIYCSAKHHLCRVFDADCDGVEKVDEHQYEAYITGDCAWSVTSCMMINGYYSDLLDAYGKKCRAITLKQASNRLRLKIEVYSSEPGMCFAEHILIKNGHIVKNKSVSYEEYCIYDYDTKEEAEKELGFAITDEQWEDGEDIIKCQFDFNNLEWEI